MELIRNWMKEFLIIYLILTVLMHLAASEQYKKYLRFFSGIILLAVLLSPVLRLSGNSGEQKVLAFYEEFWEKLDHTKQDALQLESWQDSRLISKYESAAEKEIIKQAEEMGISLSSARVQLSDDYKIEKITVWMSVQPQKKQRDKRAAGEGREQQNETAVQAAGSRQDGKDRLAAYLSKVYELDQGQIFIY